MWHVWRSRSHAFDSHRRTWRARTAARGADGAGSAALVDGDVRALGGADVDLARAADLGRGALDHLLPVRQPARQAPDGEEDREHLGGEAHRPIDETGVEVDVRVELALDEVLVVERDLL